MHHLISRAYKFRLYPTMEQQILINKTFGCCRYVYNHYLDKSIKDYESSGKSNTYNENNRDLTKLKKETDWLREVDSWALQNSLRDLDTAYKNFFRRVKKGQKPGFPKFKRKACFAQSYRTTKSNPTTDNISVRNEKIKLPKLGLVKFKQDREIKGRIVNATISRNSSGKYFVSLCCLDSEVEYLMPTNSTIGIDVGLKEFAVFSDGTVISNPKYLRKSEKRLKRLQRRFSKKQKGGKNQLKARLKLARQHEKVSNQRKDFLHKISTDIVKNHDIICCEDLNVKGMMKNHKMSKSTADVSWSEFYRQLTYKSDWYGRQFIQINRFYPSSQLCHVCGYRNKDVKDLKIREWTCPTCKTHHDRDENAAKNIEAEGLRMLSA